MYNKDAYVTTFFEKINWILSMVVFGNINWILSMVVFRSYCLSLELQMMQIRC